MLAFGIFLRQIKNPLLIILVVATVISFTVGETTNAVIIFLLIVLSILMGFWNEFSAERTVRDLLKRISLMAVVVRNGIKQEVPVKNLNPGEVVFLFPGCVVPADIILTESDNLEVDESALTGEAATIAKKNGDPAFMGTTVIRGSAQGKITAAGSQTRFGKISTKLEASRPQTSFQKGLSGFSLFLVRVVVVMVIITITINSLLGRSFIESVLFSLAIAIGITPELLPVIITVSLSHGAGRLAKKEVIVKQLVAIENLGNMDILCTDKTGTLTEGKISLTGYFDANGTKNDRILDLALLCNGAIVHHRIFGDPIDSSIWAFAHNTNYHVPEKYEKVAEEPFDYGRRAMLTVVEGPSGRELIYKGAPHEVLEFCRLTPQKRTVLRKRIVALNEAGLRVVAVATKSIEDKLHYSFADAKSLSLAGFLTFADTPKQTAKVSIERLATAGVKVKIITGDNEVITRKVCQEIGIPVKEILTGPRIEEMADGELREKLRELDIFARMTPEQKLRIVNLLKANGHCVGFLGDGINDSLALHSADVGISVNSAVDVAKDAASVVLLRKSLAVIADGVVEGRKIFANTVKYILMGTSSNFGNAFSAVGASFFLPFLPMTASQVLLSDSLYDVSQLSISSDNVDPEGLQRPQHWDMRTIRKYMLVFGPISSVYDFLTFGILLFFFRAAGSLFQTGWFVESLLTQVLVVFIIRTRKIPFLQSQPSAGMVLTCGGMALTALIIPFTPLAHLFSFVSLPFILLVVLLLLTVTYLFLVQTVKMRLNAQS
ncbi:magnesium-translocating P-type ATPase [Patescibacteria group bacterium]|nr:magnesium-translocating P-type ATPase [Patescibacteria group bacterium]